MWGNAKKTEFTTYVITFPSCDDLVNMHQTNLKTLLTRNVRRIPLPHPLERWRQRALVRHTALCGLDLLKKVAKNPGVLAGLSM